MDFRREILLAERTVAERRAARIIHALGYRIILQHHIFTGRRHYYADIFLPDYDLVVEIDGGYHFTEEQRRRDRLRTQALNRLGYRVMRVKNRYADDRRYIAQKLSHYLG
jgi:very-short-patch-repair endonuclease